MPDDRTWHEKNEARTRLLALGTTTSMLRGAMGEKKFYHIQKELILEENIPLAKTIKHI